jgi:ribosomal protein S18 acetylase RimI-like enzyme
MIVYKAMKADDHAAIMALLDAMPGVKVRDADSFEGFARYLRRNTGLSFAAEEDGAFVGCVFGGHDGRRGYLYHLAVASTHRRRGIASALVRNALDALAAEGIGKVHIDLLADNADGLAFWQAAGWFERPELVRLSFLPTGNPQG